MDDPQSTDFNLPDVKVTADDISPDAILSEVQTQRLKALKSLRTPDKDTMMLMRDMATTAVAQKRIDTDKESAAGQNEAAMAMANALKGISNPFDRSKEIEDGYVVEASFKAAEIELPAIEIVPGETSEVMDQQ